MCDSHPDILATVVGVGQVISIVPPVLPFHLSLILF